MKRTSAAPKTIDGITFECWKTGIMQTAWKTADGRATVYRPSHRATYYAYLDGVVIGQRFLTHENAMKAVVKVMKKYDLAK